MTMALFDDADPEEAKALEMLYEGLTRWPQDVPKDLALLRAMRREFPMVQVYDEVGKFVVYWSASSDRKRRGVRWHARFRNWCSNAERFRRAGPGRRDRDAAAGASGRGPRGRVGRPEDFRDSDRLEKW